MTWSVLLVARWSVWERPSSGSLEAVELDDSEDSSSSRREISLQCSSRRESSRTRCKPCPHLPAWRFSSQRRNSQEHRGHCIISSRIFLAHALSWNCKEL